MQVTDARLLAGLHSGEEAAFESLFSRHWRTVYSILFRLVGRREEAEDLTQEVFVRLFRTPPDLRDQLTLAPWLYRVATNLGYNALRKGAREANRQEKVQRLSDVEEAAGLRATDPEAASLAEEERRGVRAALSQLSEREQACLVLRHSGLSYAEVAAALGVQTGSVGTILARAEAHFRKVYQGLQEAPDGMRG
ncbi:MAG TPA: sigma-70 family RNA polymerase sigma factor [Chloroflexota bacterium]|nr:sigma-70 family RNA polymerase sigma factor [Chloroflexota bacterium]HEX2988588.1 sigma-70 family RNA polymerase sigma factor [Chloroflexota bacterium]